MQLALSAAALTRYGSHMKKFLVLYRASPAAVAEMMKSTPEQQKAGMAAWMKWANDAKASIVEMGGPLGKAVKVSKGSDVTASPNDLGGYSVLQAESKEALAAQLREHPHFMMGDGWIEVVDIMPIPGM